MAEPGGGMGARDACSRSRILLFSCSFWDKIGKIIGWHPSPPLVLAPPTFPSGNSWIRHSTGANVTCSRRLRLLIIWNIWPRLSRHAPDSFHNCRGKELFKGPHSTVANKMNERQILSWNMFSLKTTILMGNKYNKEGLLTINVNVLRRVLHWVNGGTNVENGFEPYGFQPILIICICVTNTVFKVDVGCWRWRKRRRYMWTRLEQAYLGSQTQILSIPPWPNVNVSVDTIVVAVNS